MIFHIFIYIYNISLLLLFLFHCKSMRKTYGAVYSMKVGSFKLVVAEDADSVKEVLVKKSADYAGRPPFHSFVMSTLGMFWKNC